MSLLRWTAITVGVGAAGYALNAASKPSQIVPVPKKTLSLSQSLGATDANAAIFSAGGTRYVAKLKIDSSSVLPSVVSRTPADEKLQGFVGWGDTWLSGKLAAGRRIFFPVGSDGRPAITKTSLGGSVSQYAVPFFVDTVPDNTGDVYEVTP